MITKIESGKVDISQKKIFAFAQALHTTPGYLMGWEEETPAEMIKDQKEELLVTVYRSVSDQGKAYLMQQAQIAAAMYGGEIFV